MKKQFLTTSLVIAAMIFVFSSCKKNQHIKTLTIHKEQSGNQGVDKESLGTITGTVYSQNGNVRLGAAKVYVDISGTIYYTESDDKGEFSLEVPEGEHDLMITTGDGSLYRTVLPVTIEKGKTRELPSQNTVLNQVGKMAFIAGAYDNIETIVDDTLGYNITEIKVSDLANLSTLNSYDAIFLNCGGNTQLLDTNKYDNLRSYVANGGSLYASDWAVEYYTGSNSGNKVDGSHAVKVHPGSGQKGYCATARQGGFIVDSLLCTDKTGSSGMVYSASVVDPSIQTVLGKTSIDIDYDLGAWEEINLLGPDWNTLITDNSQYGPLAVRSTNNLISSNNSGNAGGNWVTICHIPPGNPNNPQTITVSTNALQAHLAHGDAVGSCNNDGKILYTTFHNHHQGNVSQDVKKILQYFILNL